MNVKKHLTSISICSIFNDNQLNLFQINYLTKFLFLSTISDKNCSQRKTNFLILGFTCLFIATNLYAETKTISDNKSLNNNYQNKNQFVLTNAVAIPLKLNTLTNDSLINIVEDYQNQQIINQRLLNYYWLDAHHNDKPIKHNGSALGRILRNSMKDYWRNRYLDNHKNTKKNSVAKDNMNYSFRINDNQLKVQVKYKW